MRISLQILNANRVGELDILLTSLLSQTFKEWDLVLLDESDSPSIGHKHIHDLMTRIKCEGHGLIYKHVPAIHNIGASRNECYAMDEFKNEVIVRIDDDSYCEPDYLDRLVMAYRFLTNEGIKVGAVGGIVPPLGGPRTYQKLPNIFNEIKLDNQGNLISMADDGGYCYLGESSYILSHHLRSSFLFTRTAFEAVKGFPLEYGFNGFREETDFSIKLAFAGFKMYTDPYAICWHAQAGGGSRQRPPQEYAMLCQANHAHFVNKIKYWYETKGNPYV